MCAGLRVLRRHFSVSRLLQLAVQVRSCINSYCVTSRVVRYSGIALFPLNLLHFNTLSCVILGCFPLNVLHFITFCCVELDSVQWWFYCFSLYSIASHGVVGLHCVVLESSPFTVLRYVYNHYLAMPSMVFCVKLDAMNLQLICYSTMLTIMHFTVRVKSEA